MTEKINQHNNQLKNTIATLLLDKKITMIPRWKFLLYSSLGIIGLIFTLLLLVFVVSFGLFILSKYGFLYLPLFGFGAALHTLTAIPLLLVLLGIILITLTELLARHYSFGFRKPLLITISIVILFSLVIGYFVSITPFHKSIRDYARRNNISFSRAYDRPAPPFLEENAVFFRGEVLSVSNDSFVLEFFDDATSTIYFDTATTSMKDIKLMIGDDVLVIAKKDTATSTSGLLTERLTLVRIRTAPPEPFEMFHPQKERKGPEQTQSRKMNVSDRLLPDSSPIQYPPQSPTR